MITKTEAQANMRLAIDEMMGRDMTKHLDTIPCYMVDGLLRYVLFGYKPGSFLSAILSGAPWSLVLDLADANNQACLLQWRRVVANSIPAACHGSRETCRDWKGVFADA